MKKLTVAATALLAMLTVTPALAQTGIASIYDRGPTASGIHFNPRAFTAASKTLPLGSYARVTNLHNGRSVVVRIIDRGPYMRGRIIDLTPAAARAIGNSGLAHVSVEAL